MNLNWFVERCQREFVGQGLGEALRYYEAKGHESHGHTRLSIGRAMHRCATTPDCAGGCVLTRRPATGQLWRDGEGRWVRA